ncbi:MAG TPA: NEW3 domain-containing protein, partial [Candidatus Thermoplasmatota archaeon]|nr:NEW3 domain-containing protein [Candidatus Thermoplasmatota archaeon]
MAPTPAVALLVLALLAAPALAQVPAPQVTVRLDQGALEVGASALTTLNGTVSYADALPGSTANVALAVDAPEGWTITVDPAALPLSPGQSGAFTLTIQAPAGDEPVYAPVGPATLTATANAGPGRSPGTATAT